MQPAYIKTCVKPSWLPMPSSAGLIRLAAAGMAADQFDDFINHRVAALNLVLDAANESFAGGFWHTAFTLAVALERALA